MHCLHTGAQGSTCTPALRDRDVEVFPPGDSRSSLPRGWRWWHCVPGSQDCAKFPDINPQPEGVSWCTSHARRIFMKNAMASLAPGVTHFLRWVVLFWGDEPPRERCILRKNKSVVCGRVLLVTTQTSSSWREGIRELGSQMSLLRLRSTDFLHQAPGPGRGKGKHLLVPWCSGR